VSFCHLIQVHGRRVCTARAPQCSQSPVEPICPKVHVQK
jgi:endonuclease III